MRTSKNLPQRAAVISGVALIIMALLAFFSHGYVHSSLVISDEPLITLKNIQAAQALFRLEILGWLLIIIADVVVSWGFYQFLKPFHQGYALLSGWFRLIYTAILALAVTELILIDQALQTSINVGRLTEHVMLSLSTFEAVWFFGLIIFGLHLVLVGIITFKTKKVPKVISIFIILAGASYTIIHIMYSFFPSLDSFITSLELILMAPMFIGELGFGIWLLISGRKVTIN